MPEDSRNELTPRDMASDQCWDIHSRPSVTAKTLHQRLPESSTASCRNHIPLTTNWHASAELASPQLHLTWLCRGLQLKKSTRTYDVRTLTNLNSTSFLCRWNLMPVTRLPVGLMPLSNIYSTWTSWLNLDEKIIAGLLCFADVMLWQNWWSLAKPVRIEVSKYISWNICRQQQNHRSTSTCCL